mgnify:CR=1 FL=1
MIPIYEADRLEDLPLFDRPPQAEEDVDAAVAAILADVRTRGDEALREYTRRFDGADLERFEVTAEELRAAWDRVDGNFRETLRQAADNIRHFLELRGIGIINARRIFGMGAIKSSVDVDLIVNLELWDDNKVYDRMGMEDHYTDILGVQVPSITIPVKPGRNIAVILEVAAMNYREKKLGYNAAHELLQRLGMMDIDTNWDTF